MLGSYVIGGTQTASDEPSHAPQVPVLKWGYQVEYDSIIAQGYTWTRQYGWGASYINLNYTPNPAYIADNPNVFGSFAITGGRQQFSNLESNAPWLENYLWGKRSDIEVNIAYTMAYSPQYHWGNSIISLYLDLVKAGTGFPVLGGIQYSSNLESTAEWVEHHQWGEGPIPEGGAVEIGRSRAWTPQYGWGNSRIILFFP